MNTYSANVGRTGNLQDGIRIPKILVVDDQPIIAQSLYQTFSPDHQVFVATNGEQALNVCATSQPDLVLLDVVMPKMDGYEVLQRMRSNPTLSHIPVIFITASTDEQSEIHGLDIGAADFILKPIKPKIVRARVKSHLTLLAQKNALQEREKYTKVILENTIDGIITCDQFGIIHSANHAVETIFGHPAASLIGTHLDVLIAEDHQKKYKDYFNDDQYGATPEIITNETIAQHIDGHYFPIEVALSRIIYCNRPMLVVLIRNISEQRRIDQMKTDFISTVNHELRTPIISIHGALSQIVGDAIETIPPSVQTLIHVAHKNCLRLSHIINDLLDMDQMLVGALKFECKSQKLMPLIDNAVDSLFIYGKGLNISFTVTERLDSAQVNVDGDRLMQVLVNLLSNAAKYSYAGSQVEINVSRLDDKVRVAITDHGVGIPEEFHDRIFKRFEQADSANNRTSGGAGLGLAIAQEMMAHMNGEIGFTSKTNVGTCFFFDLPLGETSELNS